MRPHMEPEYIVPLAMFTKQLRAGAEWPMPPDAVKAQKAIQRLAERAV